MSSDPTPRADHRPPLRVLACPAQWFLSDTFGTESTWAFNIMQECHRRYGVAFEACCNSSEIAAAEPGVQILELGRKEAKTVTATASFMVRYFRAGRRALRRGNFDVIHHMFPFGFRDGFNPIAVFDGTCALPFVIGPIQYPQRFLHHSDLQLDMGVDESQARLRYKVEATESRVLRPVLSCLQEKTLRTADTLVFDGLTTRDLYLSAYPGLAEKPAAVIPHGIDTQSFQSTIEWPERPPEIMTASYFTRRKGIDVLVRALPRVLLTHPSLVLRAVGRGPELSRIERLAEELGVRKNVIFQGFVPRGELSKFYSRARVYVHPSLSESLPLAILEAMACGTPVVATKVGLLDEYLGETRSVELVPPGDPDALAEGILRVLERGTEERGAIARQYVERVHAWPVIAARWNAVYEAARNRHRAT